MKRLMINSLVHAALFAALLHQTAAAQTQSREQQACIKTLNSHAAQVGAQQGKGNLACLKAAGKGVLAGTAQACLTADAGGKVAAKIAKAALAETKKCVSTPSFAHTSAATASAAAQSGRLLAFADLFGADLDASAIACTTDAAACKCQRLVANKMETLTKAQWNRFVNCKRQVLGAGAAAAADVARCVNDASTATSIAADPKGKIRGVVGGLAKTIGKSCDAAGVTTAFAPGSCGSLGGAALAACIDQHVRCRVCRSINAADALDADCDRFDDGLTNSSCSAPSCDDANPCTVDAFSGGVCTHTPGNAGVICRPSINPCNPTESCDGVSSNCPVDDTTGDTCSADCRDVIADVPAAVVDTAQHTVCAQTCLAHTNLTPTCSDCGGACGLGEMCVDGACQCERGAEICVTEPWPPICAESQGRSSCGFLVSRFPGPSPYHYTFVQVNGYQDTPVFFYLDFDSLYPAGDDILYTPFSADCDPTKGSFRIPGESGQKNAFDDGGTIVNAVALSAFTKKDPKCGHNTFESFPQSGDMDNKGYYVKFTPNPGEYGENYNRMVIVINAGNSTGPVEVVIAVINILPGAPASCGDGLVQGSEQCDGANLNGASCTNAGFKSGTLACNADCTFDAGACETWMPTS